MAPETFSIALLASGRGSNLQALIDAIAAGGLPVRIVLVASDRSHADALRRAESAGIATLALEPRAFANRADFDAELFRRIAEYEPDLIVLAGFMRVLDAAVVERWSGRMINIHPSLLPKYQGLHTHRRALEAGDRVHGASVHYVSAELDGGPVLARTQIDIEPGDTAESLAKRLLPREHALLVGAVGLIASGRARLKDSRIEVDNQPLAQPLRMDAQGHFETAS